MIVKPKSPYSTFTTNNSRRIFRKEKGNSSKALANPLSDISVIYGVLKLIRRNREINFKQNKTIFSLIDRALSITMETMKEWKGMLSERACARIVERSLKFQKTHCVDTLPYFVQTSFCLAILDDRMQRKHPRKSDQYLHKEKQREALKRCISAVKQIHNYFDRKLNKPIGYYNKAVVFADAWRILE